MNKNENKNYNVVLKKESILDVVCSEYGIDKSVIDEKLTPLEMFSSKELAESVLKQTGLKTLYDEITIGGNDHVAHKKATLVEYYISSLYNLTGLKDNEYDSVIHSDSLTLPNGQLLPFYRWVDKPSTLLFISAFDQLKQSNSQPGNE